MLEYRLKFTTLPREFKKLKFIKKGKEYTLPEAEDLYGKTIDALKEKEMNLNQLGTFNCEISSMNQSNIFEFTLPAYNLEAPHLQDAIAFDLSKEKMTLSESEDTKEKLAEINEVEDSLLSEFLKPIHQSDEKQSADKEDEEDNQAEELIKRQQEEAEFLESYSQKDEESNQENLIENEVSDSYLMNEDNLNTTLEEDSFTPTTETRQERLQHQKETELLSKKDFVTLSSNEIKQEIQSLESIIQTPKQEGVSFVLDKMEIQPSDNEFIKEEKKQYLTDNYSNNELETREIALKQKINQLLNESNDALNQFYDQVISKNDHDILMEHQTVLKNDIDQEYQVKSQHQKQQNEHDYQLSIESMQQRHHQEVVDLKNNQEKEKQELVNTYQSRLKEQLMALEQDLEEKYTTEWHQIEFNDKEQLTKNKNDNLMIGKENIQSQVLNKLRQYSLEERTYLQQYVQLWNQRLAQHQDIFENTYQEYLEKQAKQQRQKEENEQKAQKERQLRLEEDKISLKKEEFASSLRDKEHEISLLKEQLEEERQKGKQDHIDYVNRQNDLIKTINAQKENMEQLMNRQNNSQGIAIKTVKKWTMVGSLVALLGMTAVGFGVHQYYTHQNEQSKQEQVQKEQAEKQKELEDTLEANQKQMEDLKQEKETLSKKNQDSQKALEKTQKALKDAQSSKKKDDKK